MKFYGVRMSNIKSYEIDVPVGTPATEAALKSLFEANGHLFEGLVLADYRGDTRYEYQPDSFKVTETNLENWPQGSFEYEVDVQYFEGCKDKDYVDNATGTVEFNYDSVSKLIKFELDETIWNPDC